MIYLSNGKLVAIDNNSIKLPNPDDYPDLVQFCIWSSISSEKGVIDNILAVDEYGDVWMFENEKSTKVSGLHDIYSVTTGQYYSEYVAEIHAITKKRQAISAMVDPDGNMISVEEHDFGSKVLCLSPDDALLIDGRVYSIDDGHGIIQGMLDPKIINMTCVDVVLLLCHDQKVHTLKDACCGVDIGSMNYIVELFSAEPVWHISGNMVITESGNIYDATVGFDEKIAKVSNPYEILQATSRTNMGITSCSKIYYILQTDGTLLVYEDQRLIRSIPNVDRIEGPTIHVPRSKKPLAKPRLGYW